MFANKPRQKALQPRVVRMISVYRHNQPRTSPPAFQITREDARWWVRNGAAIFGEPAGSLCDRGKVLVLSKPTSDRVQLRSSLGATLIFRYLRGDEEARATVDSFAPQPTT